MRILFYSDLHGISKLDKLLEFSKDEELDLVFGLGDYGSKFEDHFKQVFEGAMKISASGGHWVIFGNHDNQDEIERQTCWMPDGLNVIEGLRVFAVNGVWGNNREKLYHKNPANLIRMMPDAGQVDLLLTHEHPGLLDYNYHSGAFKFTEGREWHKSFAEAVAKYLKPKVWFYGHSYTATPDRVIPGLELRTFGLDDRAVLMDENWKVIEEQPLNS